MKECANTSGNTASRISPPPPGPRKLRNAGNNFYRKWVVEPVESDKSEAQHANATNKGKNTMNRQDTLAETILTSGELLVRFLPGFDDNNRTTAAPGLPNHAAWCLGHCALTMHRVAERLDKLPLPEADFINGDGTRGDAERFDTESVAFNSTAVDQPDHYPLLERARQTFESACDRLATAARNASDSELEVMVPWFPAEIPLWKMLIRLSFHNGAHTGQIIDLRRALGLGPVIRSPSADD